MDWWALGTHPYPKPKLALTLTLALVPALALALALNLTLALALALALTLTLILTRWALGILIFEMMTGEPPYCDDICRKQAGPAFGQVPCS